MTLIINIFATNWLIKLKRRFILIVWWKRSRRKMVRLIKVCQCIALAVILLISTTSSGRIYRRSLEDTMNSSSTDSTTSKNDEVCQENTPCGWAVYIPFTRKIDYFMKNTCVCPSDNNTLCIKVDDDLSVSAYVYRCRPAAVSNSSDTNSSWDELTFEHFS